MNTTLCTAACIAGALLLGAGPASAQEVSPPVPTPPPPPAAAPAPAPAEAAPHTVAAGEHLSAIAQARLGEDERWVEIYAVNQDTLGDPDQIEVGQVLRIPSGPVDVRPELLAELSPAPARSTSTPTSERSASASSRRVRPSSGSGSSGGGGGAGGDLASIRQCESGGDYSARSGPYGGAYQFDRQTWASVGGSGDPAAASPGEQDARASRLRSERGSSPWPNCG